MAYPVKIGKVTSGFFKYIGVIWAKEVDLLAFYPTGVGNEEIYHEEG